MDLDAMPVMMEIMFVLEDGDRKHKKKGHIISHIMNCM